MEVSAECAHSKSLDLERVQGTGKVKEGCCWGLDLQERAGSHEEQVDHVNPTQRSAAGHWVEPRNTWWEASDAQREPGVVD